MKKNISNLKINMRKTLRIIELAILAVAFAALPALAQDGGGGGGGPQQWLQSALEWIDGLGTAGPIAFIIIYAVAAVAFLPGSVLTLGGGVIFGVFLGSIFVFIGATLGATLAFLVGRYVARGWISKKIEGDKKFKAIDEAVGREGLKIVILTRLSPIFPFNLLNYGFGVTGVSLKDYVIGSVGMIPGTVMYVYFGSLAGNLATLGAGDAPGNPVAEWAIRIVGLIATVAVTLYVTKVAKKALNDAIGEEEQVS